jgi:hypothetical protein
LTKIPLTPQRGFDPFYGLEEKLYGKLKDAIAVLDRGRAEIIIYLANHSIGILPEGESQIAGVWK